MRHFLDPLVTVRHLFPLCLQLQVPTFRLLSILCTCAVIQTLDPPTLAIPWQENRIRIFVRETAHKGKYKMLQNNVTKFGSLSNQHFQKPYPPYNIRFIKSFRIVRHILR